MIFASFDEYTVYNVLNYQALWLVLLLLDIIFQKKSQLVTSYSIKLDVVNSCF